MKRHHYVLARLHQVFTARITAEPLYELKTAFSLHAYLCAEHVAALRQRVGELREPPLGLDVVPHEGLQLACDEVLCSPSAVELTLGIYGVVVPALLESLEAYLRTTNPLADAPSVRVARFCLLEMRDLVSFGEKAIAALVDEAARQRLSPWLQVLRDAIASAGGISGRGACFQRAAEEEPASIRGASTFRHVGNVPHDAALMEPASRLLKVAPHFSKQPYQYDAVPKRDARFRDSYNAGVNPEAFLYDDRFSPRDKTLMMFYKRLREIDVPEMMASIIHQTPGKPWRYYRDMSRQLWDEARHAMLGELGFVHLGIDWTAIPINFTWSLNLNTQLTPQERHAVLFFIEQGLMPRTGKRYEWEVGQQSGDRLAGVIQDFDWADEVLHAQLGREWYVKGFGDLAPAMDYGDRCWSKVLSRWREYLETGLTQHRNWWPEIYKQACDRWGVTPDPRALAFNETYEAKRADLQAISASA
jgi:hypothetical protein